MNKGYGGLRCGTARDCRTGKELAGAKYESDCQQGDGEPLSLGPFPGCQRSLPEMPGQVAIIA